MTKNILISLKYLLVSIIIFGVFYTLFITGIGYVFFRDKINGSVIEKDGVVIGSSLIAQKFQDPKFFHPRPSACDYGTMPSSASNYGALNPELKKEVDSRIKELGADAPAELLFTSGSGLDPHIRPATALFQIDRILTARALPVSERSKLVDLIKEHTEKPQLRFLGPNRVNVLELNLAMEKVFNGK